MNEFPPPNYIQTESTVEGIEVYMPAPPEAPEHREIVDFKCPQCGANTAYSVAEGGLKCTHCGYYEPPPVEIVGKGAQEFEFTVETMQEAAHGWGEARKQLECQNCGAQVTLPVTALTATCPYCASNKVIQRDAPQDVLRPRFLIPFQIDAGHCAAISREWLGSSWMTPKNLEKIARIADFNPIYLPYWTFDSLASAGWRAEVGHTETERYYDHGSKEWRTRTRVVWRWESGSVRVTFDDLVVAGTKKLSPLLLGRIRSFDLTRLTPYNAKFLAGMQAQAYDVPLENAWEIAREEMRAATRETCLGQASTSQVRNFSMTLDFSEESWRYVLLPVYVAVYRYQDQVYQVLVNGQTGAIGGQRPVDWNKVWLAIAGLLSPGIILGLFGLGTVIFGGIGVPIAVVGFVLLIIGLIIAAVIFRKAQRFDDA